MANVVFNGSASAQAAAGETVTITVTDPNKNVTTVTATTNTSGAYVTAPVQYAVAGTYSYVAAIPADPEYQAQSVPGTFIVELAPRTLTVTVTVT